MLRQHGRSGLHYTKKTIKTQFKPAIFPCFGVAPQAEVWTLWCRRLEPL
jgi:hypothetical protein